MKQLVEPPGRIPLKDRISVLFVERGHLDVQDGAFVVVDERGVRRQIPVGGVTCLMLEPGSRVSHAAVKLCAKVRCLLLWVGEAGVRLYAAGRPGGARADRLLYQARLALDETLRLRVVRRMFSMRFGHDAPQRRSVNQLRGIEGARVRALYEQLARQHGVKWTRRNYNPEKWEASDVTNRCLSSATASLYGICEAAILAAGYSPAIGFIHTGKPLSFVYDIADLFKFDSVVPLAFAIAGKRTVNPERDVRLACRDAFRKTRLLQKIIPTIDEVLESGGLEVETTLKPGQVPPAIPAPEEEP